MIPRYQITRSCFRTLSCIALLLLAVSLAAVPADAQIAIGFCQGAGGFHIYSVSFLVCCEGDLVPTLVTASTPPVDCSSAAAVMAAMNAAIGGMLWDGAPIFGAPVPVASPVPGQARFEYPLAPGFLAAGCCIVGGSVDVPCGTMSLRINPPCAKNGDGGGGGRPTKLCIDSGPPPVPIDLNIMVEGCPLIAVALDGTETAAEVRAKVVAALLLAGYTAFINDEDKVEITGDCGGALPTGIDEFGLTGGVPMDLGVEICPPPDDPTATEETTWGAFKERWRN